MKSIIVLILFLFGINSVSTEPKTATNVLIKQLTFDAYEGEYYIFTDSTNKSVVLASDTKEKSKWGVLESNNSIGRQFKVEYMKVEPSAETSNDGIIINFENVK